MTLVFKDDGAQRQGMGSRDSRIAMFQAVATFEHAALKACFVVNGGALIAVVAFLGNILTKDPPLTRLALDWLYAAVASWCVGLLLAVAAHAAGYWSQVSYFRATGNVDSDTRAGLDHRGYVAANWAYGFFIVSSVAFAVGTGFVLASLP